MYRRKSLTDKSPKDRKSKSKPKSKVGRTKSKPKSKVGRTKSKTKSKVGRTKSKTKTRSLNYFGARTPRSSPGVGRNVGINTRKSVERNTRKSVGRNVGINTRKSVERNTRKSVERNIDLNSNFSTSITLQPHQIPPIYHIVARCKSQHGIILNHYMGTGKTITALVIVKNFPSYPVVIIHPPELKEIWLRELDKLNFSESEKKEIEFLSYDELLSFSSSHPLYLENKLVIMDEAHHIIKWFYEENVNKSLLSDLFQWLSRCFKVILLTGTPFWRSESDMRYLVNIAAGRRVVPYKQKEFEEAFFKTSIIKSVVSGWFVPVMKSPWGISFLLIGSTISQMWQATKVIKIKLCYAFLSIPMLSIDQSQKLIKDISDNVPPWAFGLIFQDLKDMIDESINNSNKIVSTMNNTLLNSNSHENTIEASRGKIEMIRRILFTLNMYIFCCDTILKNQDQVNLFQKVDVESWVGNVLFKNNFLKAYINAIKDIKIETITLAQVKSEYETFLNNTTNELKKVEFDPSNVRNSLKIYEIFQTISDNSNPLINKNVDLILARILNLNDDELSNLKSLRTDLIEVSDLLLGLVWEKPYGEITNINGTIHRIDNNTSISELLEILNNITNVRVTYSSLDIKPVSWFESLSYSKYDADGKIRDDPIDKIQNSELIYKDSKDRAELYQKKGDLVSKMKYIKGKYTTIDGILEKYNQQMIETNKFLFKGGLLKIVGWVLVPILLWLCFILANYYGPKDARSLDTHFFASRVAPYISYFKFSEGGGTVHSILHENVFSGWMDRWRGSGIYSEDYPYPRLSYEEKDVAYNSAQMKVWIRTTVRSLNYEELMELGRGNNLEETEKFGDIMDENTYLNHGRKIGNYTPSSVKLHSSSTKHPFDSYPLKFREILSLIMSDNPLFKRKQRIDAPAVVWSNFEKGGILEFSEFLNGYNEKSVSSSISHSIPFAVYQPTLSQTAKNQILEDFKNKKYMILLLYPQYTEGLSILGARQLHIMEPILNLSTKEQLMARVRRYKSHMHLPLAERHVKVFQWYCTTKGLWSNVTQFYHSMREWINSDFDKIYWNRIRTFSQDLCPDSILMSRENKTMNNIKSIGVYLKRLETTKVKAEDYDCKVWLPNSNSQMGTINNLPWCYEKYSEEKQGKEKIPPNLISEN
jgi:hypothetical protein